MTWIQTHHDKCEAYTYIHIYVAYVHICMCIMYIHNALYSMHMHKLVHTHAHICMLHIAHFNISELHIFSFDSRNHK